MLKTQTTWMYPNQLFIISGGASANSLFLEDKSSHEIFFDYFKRFVEPMVDLIHYKLTKTGWVLLIKTKSKLEINSAYLRQRNKSDKSDRTKDLIEPQRMLSEHLRMFLSNFAKRCNYILGRGGVWVKKRVENLRITNEKQYSKQFDLICDLQACNYRQLKKKYQAREDQYDKDKLLLDEDTCPNRLRSSVSVYNGCKTLEEMPVRLRLVRPFSDVLRKILNNNNKNQNPDNPLPKIE